MLGSVGPGTKLPTLRHATYAALRDAFAEADRGLVDGGSRRDPDRDRQDLLQTKASVIGAKHARAEKSSDLPVIVNVTVETTGTLLLGTEIGAALTALEPLGIDLIGLNCATGPTEMSEHLRYLSRHAKIPITCMPNAGLPELTADGALYPLTPEELAEAHEHLRDGVRRGPDRRLLRHHAGTHRQVLERVGGRTIAPREPEQEAGVSSLYSHVPFRQDTSYLSIGERTNANGSKAFREAMLAEDWDDCIQIARAQTREGSHLLDLCIDYVGRDGVAGHDASRRPARDRVDAADRARLDRDAGPRAGLELLGGRCIINSVNFEDGDGPTDPGSRGSLALVAEHGAAVIALTIDEQGQARTAEHKLDVAKRLVDSCTRTRACPSTTCCSTA